MSRKQEKQAARVGVTIMRMAGRASMRVNLQTPTSTLHSEIGETFGVPGSTFWGSSAWHEAASRFQKGSSGLLPFSGFTVDFGVAISKLHDNGAGA